MIIIQRTPAGDVPYYVCDLKSCSVAEKAAEGGLVPVGWCLTRTVHDMPNDIIPSYCCAEHALEDDGRPATLLVQGVPLDDAGIAGKPWGLR